MTAFALRLGLGASPRLFAGQPVQLGIQATSHELLLGLDLLSTLPPLSLLGRLGDRLGAGLRLGDFGPFTYFSVGRFFFTELASISS